MTTGQRIAIYIWLSVMFLASWYVPCDETRAGNYVGLHGVTIFHPGHARPGVRVNGVIWLLEIMLISGTAFWCFHRLAPPVTMMCTRCGYDLRGSIPAGAETCPECGESITDEQKELQQVEPDNHPHNPTAAARDAVVVALCAGAALSLMFVALDKFPALTGGPKSHLAHPEIQDNLHAINKAMKMYAHTQGNGSSVPIDVALLAPKYLDAKVFDLRDEPKPPRWSDDRVYCRGRYYFVAYDSLDVESSTNMVMAFTTRLSKNGRIVMFLDGHTELIFVDDFPACLDATLDALRRQSEGNRTNVPSPQ